MARLVPSFFDDVTPPGERDVFNLLAAGPDDWVAIHSLDLSPWNRNLRTEIDFLVVVPDTGVLCVEVKSHDVISFDGQRWHPNSIKRSPFKQACDGRYTFCRRMAEIAPQFRGVPIVHCCVFPNATFDMPVNLSVQSWELMDRRTFRSFGSGDTFCAALKAKMVKAIGADAAVTPLRRTLSQSEIRSIVDVCVPVQRFRPDRRAEVIRREEDADRVLRQQQSPVLRLAQSNPRLVVHGGAGTGKTLIAMELAQRVAGSGRRVALLCFNQLVGDWMSRKIESGGTMFPNLVVGRAIRVLAEMCGVQIPSEPTRRFWDAELSAILEDRLTDPEFRSVAPFDYLVIDEAQDILARPWLWSALCEFLIDGIANGSYAIFGDFDHQALHGSQEVKRALAGLDTAGRPTHWDLTENCRNYRIIGETAVRLAGFGEEVYSGYLRGGGAVSDYGIYFYKDDQAQLARLISWLQEFQAHGFAASEITILSFCSPEHSAASRLVERGYKLRPAWQRGRSTGYTSVHAFKGMENKAILLTDVSLEDQEFHRDLFYTGLTRATESVRVLCDASSQQALSRWILGSDDI